MSFVETKKVTANRCSCPRSRGFVISGSTDLFTKQGNNLKLPTRFTFDDHPKMLQSILVFCCCGHLTVHYMRRYPNALKWKSRKMGQGWRHRRIKIKWPLDLPDEQRTLRNVTQLLIMPRIDHGGTPNKGVYFVNNPADNYNIHPDQAAIAEEVFDKLLTCRTYLGFADKIDYRIRDSAIQAMAIANRMLDSRVYLQQCLPGIVQELFNLRHMSRSPRLEGVRIALETMCVKAGITLPKLLDNDRIVIKK